MFKHSKTCFFVKRRYLSMSRPHIFYLAIYLDSWVLVIYRNHPTSTWTIFDCNRGLLLLNCKTAFLESQGILKSDVSAPELFLVTSLRFNLKSVVILASIRSQGSLVTQEWHKSVSSHFLRSLHDYGFQVSQRSHIFYKMIGC